MKRLLYRFLVIIVLCVYATAVEAQTVVAMANGNTIEIDACQNPTGVITDNGGLSDDYSNSFNGYVILSAPVGVIISVTGDYNTESCCDYLNIYDGYGVSSSTQLGNFKGQGTISVSATSGYLTLYFHTDASVVRTGFELYYTMSGLGTMCNNTPSNLAVGNITTTSAQVSWIAPSSTGSYMLSLNDGTPIVVTGTSHTFTGLAPGTVYDVKVSSLADSLSPCCTVKKRFRTTCHVITRNDLPYQYGFEDATITDSTSTIDSCWTRLTSSLISEVCPTVFDANTGNYSVNMMIPNGRDNAFLVLPEYVDSLSMTQLRFSMRNRTIGGSGRVEVGVMSDPFDTNTFVRVGSVRNNDTEFETRAVPLIDYMGNGRYVAMCIRGGASDLLIDDVVLELLPECSVLDHVSVENVAVTSLAVSWGVAIQGSTPTVGFEVVAEPEEGGSIVSITVPRSPAIVSGLEPMTSYKVRVRPICSGDTYGGWDSVTVFTMCTGYRISSMSGSYQNTITGVPVYSGYGNTVSQSIYTVSDLTAMGVRPGILKSIQYNWSENSSYAKQLEVYLGTTSMNNYSSNTFLTSNMMHVYSGAHPLGTSGVHSYSFNTPFYWDGVSNLVVTTMMNQPPGVSQIYSNFYGYSSYSGSTQTVYKYRDNTPYVISDLATLTSIYSSQYKPNIALSSCDSTLVQCFGPMIVVDTVGFNDVTISWAPGGTETEWEVAYRPASSASWTVVATHYTGTSYHFMGLSRSTEYVFRLTAPCGSSTAQSSINVITRCRQTSFNYDDLYGEHVVCRTGSFSNPDMTVGVVDYGSSSNLSRHTIHNDRSETDGYTGGQLHTVPEGYCTSVRLGNWSTGAEAESITYTFDVDTADYDMLLLKYAAVLQDPNHSPIEQPRFTFLITDVNGDTISPCYNADFISNANLGWNSGSSSVLWKDWTTVGVDLSPMHGQIIRIKLTSYDCDQGGHFGYAYFVIDLDNKALRSNNCSSEENTFYAPSGFSYSWYSGNNPNNILSVTDSLHVTDEGVYYCDLSFVGAPDDEAHSNCFFTMMAISGVRYPFARFTPVLIDTASCRYSWMRMVNQSIVTRDSAHLDSMANGCETYLWMFDDGTTSSDINPRHAFTPGIHTVTLYAMLADGQCSDSVSHTFLIESPCMVRDTVYVTLCDGDAYHVFDTVLTTPGEYLLDSIGVSDSLFIRMVYLSVNPRSFDTVSNTVCDGYLWPLTGVRYTLTGLYNDTLVNDYGCDSIVTLDLTVYPAYHVDIYDTVCRTALDAGYPWGGSVIHATDIPDGTYTDSLHTNSPLLCDSVVTLHLEVLPVVYGDTVAVACDSFAWYGTVYGTAVTDTLAGRYTSVLGCDSSVVLHLTLNYSSQFTYYDTCTEGDLPRHFGSLTAYGDTVASFVLANAVGCDSTVTYRLTVLGNSRATFDTTLCENRLPIQWYHRFFTGPGTQYDTIANHLGADSILTLILHVSPVNADTLAAAICSGQGYLFEGFTYYDSGTYTHTLQNRYGCDSLRTLLLTVNPTTHGDTLATACDTFRWAGNTLVQSDTLTIGAYALNRYGCDSSVTLHLTLNHSSQFTYYDTCTESDLPRHFGSLTAHGDTVASLVLANAAGCDSTVTYHLTVLGNSRATFDTTLCENRLPIQWYHRLFTGPGTQNDTIANHLGADSILTLTLHVSPVSADTIAAAICSGQGYLFEGVTYYDSGTYTRTLQNHYGCDSLRTLRLTVNPATHGDTVAMACDTFRWAGNTFVQSDTLTVAAYALNHFGCDSSVTLHLTLNHSSVFDSVAEACDSYMWYGQTYTSAPAVPPVYTLVNAVGCDSTVRLVSLTIHHSVVQDSYDTLCPAQLATGYAWADTLFGTGTATGVYTLHRPTVHGCDSALVLHLTVYGNSSASVYDTIVENQASSWQYHGVAVTDDTTDMVVTIVNHHGCDSVVNYNLYIWRNTSYAFDSSICANQTAAFEWHGLQYADTLHWQLLTVHGADSLVTLAMHLLPVYQHDVYDTVCRDMLDTGLVWGDTIIYYDGSDTVSYTRRLLSQLQCDSIVTLHLVINPVYNIVFYDTVYYGDTVLFEGIVCTEPGVYVHRHVTDAGCDSLHTLYLYGRNMVADSRTDTLCEGDSLVFGGHVITEAGTYVDTIVSGNFTVADTLLSLTVVVVPYPTVDFDTTVVCGRDAYYSLSALTGASWLQWNSSPRDPSLEGQEHSPVVRVKPTVATLYTLEADYRSRPLCRVADTIRIAPIDNITAVIECRPPYITLNERELVAYDRSRGRVQSRRWYVFYNDNAPFAVDESPLRLSVPHYVDSLAVALAVEGVHCADTDTLGVEILRSGIFFPNVFTPSRESNNLFRGTAAGVRDFELWIYDRRGALVFHSTDVEEGWDGTHDGQPCRQETYVYRCRYSDEEVDGYQSVTGTVTLVR